MRLERKVGGHWKTLTTGKTGRGGNFTVSARAAQPGKWKVRVEVPNGKGNLGDKTRSVNVKVKKRVPPPPDDTDVDQGNHVPDVYTPPVEHELPPGPAGPDPPRSDGRSGHRLADHDSVVHPSGPYLVPCRPSDEAGD